MYEIYENFVQLGFCSEIAYKMAKDISDGWKIKPISRILTNTEQSKQYDINVYAKIHKDNVKCGDKRKYNCVDDSPLY